MPESIKNRVVIEEVVVDVELEVGGTYRDSEIKSYIEQTVKSALDLHTVRKH